MKAVIDSSTRLTIPLSLIMSAKVSPGKYLKVTIRKGSRKECFYIRVPSKAPSRKYLQVRRKLPKSVIGKLELKPKDKVEVIELAEIGKAKTTRYFVGNKFDLLSLQLENVMAEPFTKNGEEWCRFWPSSKNGGLANFVELKRFIPINRETGEFFGLMQAESSKRGWKLDFTNTLVGEHKLFVTTAEKFGIPVDAWKWGMIVNPTLPENYIEKCTQKFREETSLGPPSYNTNSKTILSVAYQIYVSRNILNRLFNGALVVLRKQIPEALTRNSNNNYENFCEGFITKYLLGDGTITFPSDSNVQIVLTEGDAESRKDFQAMLRLFGIHSSQQDIRVYASTDFDSLLWFVKNDLFIGHDKNRKKLIACILRNYYMRTAYERLSKSDGISIKDYAKAIGLTYNTASMSLHRYRKRDFISSKRNGKETIFQLTERGKRFIEIIRKIENEAKTNL